MTAPLQPSAIPVPTDTPGEAEWRRLIGRDELRDIHRLAMFHFRRLRRELHRPLRAGDQVTFDWPNDEGLEHNSTRIVSTIEPFYLDHRYPSGGQLFVHWW